MKKTVLIAVICFCLLLTVAGCAKTPLTGTWLEADASGNATENVITFENDGRVTYTPAGVQASASGTYTVDEEAGEMTLTIDTPGGTPVSEVYTYTLEDNTLTLTGKTNGITTQYFKQ